MKLDHNSPLSYTCLVSLGVIVLMFPVLISTLFIRVAYKAAVQSHWFSDKFWGTSEYIAKKNIKN